MTPVMNLALTVLALDYFIKVVLLFSSKRWNMAKEMRIHFSTVSAQDKLGL